MAIMLPWLGNAQVVYEPVTNNPVYDLLDELAALKVITINSVVKPYSRVFIANKLNLALQNPEKLNKRQLAEVEFYLKDYGFDLTVTGYWSLVAGNDYQTRSAQPETSNQKQATSPASFNVNPISFRLNTNVLKMSIAPQLGSRFIANENGTFFEASGGGEVYGYLGKHIGYYVNYKHVHQSEPMVNPVMLTLEEGKSWHTLSDGSVYSNEWRGGLSVGWKWGDFGVYKDRPIWGNANHGSNIMSGHAPSFPYFQLHLRPAKWIEFYSMTGFLKSNVVDSSRSTFSYEGNDITYRSKYFSANFFTITPWKGLDLSLGNSIFWSDQFRVGYLLPFNLYKSLDQTYRATAGYTTYNTNDDGHLFLDISSRNIKHLNLYLGLWIDELQMARFFKTNQHNLLSWKLGFSLYDLPVKNLSLTAEYLTTRPATYEEYNPANLYANDDYSFGNYLRGDAWEIFVNLKYKPVRGLQLSASYNLAQRGGYEYMKDDFVTYPLAQNLVFNQTTIEINGSYQLTTNVYFSLGYRFNQHSGDVQFIPEIMRGNTNSFIAGISLGL
jgi:hypothetical protein